MSRTTIRCISLVGVVLLAASAAVAQSDGRPGINEFDRGRPGANPVVPLPEPVVPDPVEPPQVVWSEPQLLGFTHHTFPGNRGVLNLARACRQEFGPSRMCTLEEINRSMIIPDEPGRGLAWVNVVGDVAEVGRMFEDRTTISNLSNCRGWTTTAPDHEALALDLGQNDCFGGLMLVSCDATLSVACCGFPR